MRPICVHCGKPYGQRHTTTEQLRWPVGEERPAYKGNGVVLKEGHAYQTADRQTARGLTMLSPRPEVRVRQEADLARLPEKPSMSASRTIWDGETYWGGYEPFCTLRCALDYARKAYAAATNRSKMRAV